MQVVLISGLSGSGKSIALNVLEDSGYYCVDNLPAPLLSELIGYLRLEGHGLAAVAVDMRGGASIAALPPQLRNLEAQGITLRLVFLDARNEVLIQRFSETRRRHPLASAGQTLEEAIRTERELLNPISDLGHRIDTSGLKANALREWVRQFIEAEPGQASKFEEELVLPVGGTIRRADAFGPPCQRLRNHQRQHRHRPDAQRRARPERRVGHQRQQARVQPHLRRQAGELRVGQALRDQQHADHQRRHQVVAQRAAAAA